ncbi:hypothetical protein [Actinoplanes sp. NPDC051859]|uniref:hypothetical protein n=1 Tax=Actinoplanes sp. NPDC051859 TaxID=3363909 RepID=UPI0037A1FF40
MDRPAEQIFAMLGENDHRTDLTVSERSKGYAQLAAFDIAPAEIARRAAIKIEHVRAAIRLDAMGDDVKAKADAGQLNFDDILALKEFEDDPKVEQRIISAAGTAWGARHEMAVERKKRKDKARAAELKAELKAAGVREVPRPKAWPYESKAVGVNQLVDAEGNRLDEKAVKTQEGFAAFVDMQNAPVSVVYVCLDPEGMGYTRPRGNTFKSAEQQKAVEQTREAEDQRRAALDVAAPVRRRFIREQWGSAKAAKELLEEATRTAAVNPSELMARNTQDYMAVLAGGSLDNLSTARLDRLQRVQVCRWIADQEEHIADVSILGWTFKTEPQRAIDWFDRLTAQGYGLSPAETDLYERLTVRASDLAAEVQRRAAAERRSQVRKAEQVAAGERLVFTLWPVSEGDRASWELVTGHGKYIGDLVSDDLRQVQQWAVVEVQDEGFVAEQWQEKRDEESSTTYYVMEVDDVDSDAQDEPEAGADDGDDAEPVFALFPVDEDGKPQWWLIHDDFGTAIGELYAGPDEVDRAQEWATDFLASMQFQDTTWRAERGGDLVPDHYRATWPDEQDDGTAVTPGEEYAQ